MANHVFHLTNHATRSAGKQSECSRSGSPLVWKSNLCILVDVLALHLLVGEATYLSDPGDRASLPGVVMLAMLAGPVLAAGVLAKLTRWVLILIHPVKPLLDL